MIFPSGGVLNLSSYNQNLGSAYVIAYLRKNGFRAEQFISKESFNVKECVKKIANYNPKIVGFTVYEKNYMQCVLISKGLKAHNSKIIIVFGGPTPSVQSKEILESTSSIDLCVRWEGEETMLKLLTTLSENSFNLIQANLDNIKGITFRNEDKIITNPDSNILLSNRLIKNYLDNYPSPYLSKVIPASEAFPTGIITARGCNQNCVYCNCAIISKRNIFLHSIERVIEELSFLNEYNKFESPVPINDDGFTIIPSRAKRICERIIETNIKVPLSCITRCDKITEELLDLMREAGFASIGFSLESAVPRVLRAIGKVNPPKSMPSEKFVKEMEFIEKLKNMTSYAKKIGMYPVFVSIMIGLPGETIEDAQKTIELVKKLDIDFYTHNYLHIYKGTPLYRNYKSYGYKIEPIGQKNTILLNNNFPFDVYKVKLAPKSAIETNSKVIDYNILKILSFNLKRENMKTFFDNIIINSDFIKPTLVKWIQENLAINGTIIHIYSNKLKYMKFHKENEATLYNEFSPTMYYESYYWENSNKAYMLKPGRTHLLGEQTGLYIKLQNAASALEDYKEGNTSMENLICSDHTTIDTRAIYNLLNEISKSEDSFDYLLERRLLPQFQNLCRWTKDQSNCQKLETAIIGDDDSIRICWHSDPIGKVGISFSNIMRNLQHLKKEKVERRKCNKCIKNETCLKCIFPYPLSSEEYCEIKRKNDTNKPAYIINTFNILKDFLYMPINPLDY